MMAKPLLRAALVAAFAVCATAPGALAQSAGSTSKKPPPTGVAPGVYVCPTITIGADGRVTSAITGDCTPGSGGLLIVNNLSDLANPATARANLGLGSAAQQATSAFLQAINNLADLASPATARTNLGLGSIATHATTDFLAAANNLSELANPSAARTNLGLGSIATHAATDFLAATNNLSDLANAATARTNLGLAAVAASGSASDLGTGTLPAARLPATSVTAGSYTCTNATFDATGRATAASNGSCSGGGAPGGTVSQLQINNGSGGFGGIAQSTFLASGNNLSDLANAATARTNLGLGSIATHATTDFLAATNNLSDLANAATARTNLGLGSIATHATTDFLAAANNLSELASAPVARVNLNIDEVTFHGDSIYSIAATDRCVFTNAALTAARIWTLPAASAVNAGQMLCVYDAAGGVTATNTLTVTHNGSDTIGSGTSAVINAARGGLVLQSDGISKWTIVAAIWPQAAGTNTFLTGFDPRTGFTARQPATSDISGLAAVASSGSAADLGSGTLACARLPAFAGGDATTSAGSCVLTIAASAVTYAKMQNTAAASILLGRGAGAGAGPLQEIALGSGLSMSGTTLSASATAGVSSLATGSNDLNLSGSTGAVTIDTKKTPVTCTITSNACSVTTGMAKELVTASPSTATATINIPAASTYGANNYTTIYDGGTWPDVIMPPSGTINGFASITIPPGGTSCPVSDGSNWTDPCSQPTSAADALTAHAGGGQSSALQLTATVNNVSTVATAADSVKLLPTYAGEVQIVCNSAASNAMQVFGSGSDTINSAASGTGVSQAAGLCTIYSSSAAGKWLSTPLSLAGSGSGIAALTGDVAASGSGSVPATIQPGAVSSSKMASGAAATNVGTLGGDLSGTLPNPTVAKVNGDANVAMRDVADQALTGGFNITTQSLGTISSGTTTIDCGARGLQSLTDNGAFTLAAPSNDGQCAVQVTNGASAGAITFSGFSDGASNTGDALDTVSGHKFLIQIIRAGGVTAHFVHANQ